MAINGSNGEDVAKNNANETLAPGLALVGSTFWEPWTPGWAPRGGYSRDW